MVKTDGASSSTTTNLNGFTYMVKADGASSSTTTKLQCGRHMVMMDGASSSTTKNCSAQHMLKGGGRHIHA